MTASSILPAPPPRLSPGEFEEIRVLAHRTFGLDLKRGKEEMVSARLGRLVSAGGHASFHEYAQAVTSDRTGASLAALIDALATNHTSFLREADHFDFFRRRVAPELAARATADLWCAACSTGEEVWTLACVCNEAGAAHRCRISASDISVKALRRAQAGEYAKETCASLPAAWLARYFDLVPGQDAGQRYRVNARLRAQVEFRRINLMAAFPWQRPFAAIFCRNVMIYFDHRTQQSVVGKLEKALEPGGYLFTGHAESLAGVEHNLEYIQPAIYRKPPARRGW